jgi:hypothetical protein
MASGSNSGRGRGRGRGRPPKNIPVYVDETVLVPTKDAMEEDDLENILQQIYDNEIAMAVEKDNISENLLYQMRKEQEESDAQFARQLAEEDNPLPPAMAQGDDIDDVLEQIRKMEAQELLKKKGNAYDNPLNLDRIMQQNEAEDDAILQKILQNTKNADWQTEKIIQDLEYEEALRQETEKQEALRKETEKQEALRQETEKQEALRKETEKQEALRQETEKRELFKSVEEDIPKTREEIRLARLKFFTKQNK